MWGSWRHGAALRTCCLQKGICAVSLNLLEISLLFTLYVVCQWHCSVLRCISNVKASHINKRRKVAWQKLLFYEYDIDTFLDAFFDKNNSLSVSFWWIVSATKRLTLRCQVNNPPCVSFAVLPDMWIGWWCESRGLVSKTIGQSYLLFPNQTCRMETSVFRIVRYPKQMKYCFELKWFYIYVRCRVALSLLIHLSSVCDPDRLPVNYPV